MALRLQEEHGDDLAVIFVESQGHSQEQIEQFALERKWLGGRALWTSERPVRSNARGLPSFVLLDTEGRRILEGSSSRLKQQMEDAIAAEIGKQRKGPDDVAKDLRGPAKDLLRARFADAIDAAEKLVQSAGEDADLAADAAALASEARARADALVRRVGRLIDAGRYSRADELLVALEKGVDGHDALEQAVADARARLEADGLEDERKAERSLSRLEAVLAEKGPGGVHARLFAKLAEKYAGTKAAGRAEHLASLLAD